MTRAELRTADRRNRRNGKPIPSLHYCDQPYVAALPDGGWVCVMTTGTGNEGDPGQHIIAVRSDDRGESWSEPVAIEPPDGPEASWAVPAVTEFGRIYVFYTYNGDRITTLPGSEERVRSDTHGHYAFKYSDDGGRSWSARRGRIPLPAAPIDRENPWRGSVCHFWGIDKPKICAGRVEFAFSRIGKFFSGESEGWIVSSPNLLTERDPEKLRFDLLPAGEHGLCNRALGGVQEEFNLLPLNAGERYCVCRTWSGYPLAAYSSDGGASWTTPEPMRYAPGKRIMRTPRACPKLFDAGDGRYLFWYHHNAVPGWSGRNPVFLSGGRRYADGRIHWSEPEIVLYDIDETSGMSYPDLIAADGEFFLSETNKTEARLHQVDPVLLRGLWDAPAAPDREADEMEASFGAFDRGGWSLELAGILPAPGALLWRKFDDGAGKGVIVECAEADGETVLRITLADGANSLRLDSDAGKLTPGAPFHAVATADWAAGVLGWIVNGEFEDGGGRRPLGWLRIPPEFGAVACGHAAETGDGIRRSLWTRALRTAEAVALHQETKEKKS